MQRIEALEAEEARIREKERKKEKYTKMYYIVQYAKNIYLSMIFMIDIMMEHG